MTKFNVLRQDWLESERGWGQRPDGYSLHLTRVDVRQFVNEYWDRMPDEVPDEYSRPRGEPFLVDVDDVTYLAVKASKNGTRHY
jgi:hypothetical protein